MADADYLEYQHPRGDIQYFTPLDGNMVEWISDFDEMSIMPDIITQPTTTHGTLCSTIIRNNNSIEIHGISSIAPKNGPRIYVGMDLRDIGLTIPKEIDEMRIKISDGIISVLLLY